MEGVLPRNQILVGDARRRLAELPAASVDTVITSPPYFGLRDYGHPDQLGLESTVDDWVAQLGAVCRMLSRVLKPGGSLWLNVGDGYSNHRKQGAAGKSLLLGPQKLALALAVDGWVIRNQVVWAKPNAMPASVSDRLNCTYEVLLFLVRSPRYFFDLDAIRVPLRSARRPARSSPAERLYPPPEVVPPGSGVSLNRGLGRLTASGQVGHPFGKNPGDVWMYGKTGFRGAHFATFPLSLIERPVLATCPERVCASCGQPWQRAARQRDDIQRAHGEPRPSCGCRGGTRPGVVLDPFMGSGTVALAAEQHRRDWLGIELNPDFAAMAEERLRTARRPRQRRRVAQCRVAGSRPMVSAPLFLLGTHQPGWLATAKVPLFVSDRRLCGYRRLPRASAPWALDSGAFSELAIHGNWDHGPSPRQYVDRVRRYQREIGRLLWAAPQDWMCEPFIVTKTGLSIVEHQRRTVANLCALRQIAPDLPFIPVVQGWTVREYVSCVTLYRQAGVDLAAERLVGVGSVCRRQATADVEAILRALHGLGLTRLHGFGVKLQGLRRYGDLLVSADSMAWSFAARRSPRLPDCPGRHRTCANCPMFAYRWRNRLLGQVNRVGESS